MKYILFQSTILLYLLLCIHAQSLDWIQESPKTGGMFLRASFIRSDAQDDIYVVKMQASSSPGGTAGSGQILKYNATNGSLLWTTPGPRQSINPIGWFDVADDGSSFITGSNYFLDDPPTVYGFVQKFYPNGTIQWTKLFPNAFMGRAVPLPDGRVRVEGTGNSSLYTEIPFDNFAIHYDEEGNLLESKPLINVITSSGALNPVAASQSNSEGEFCGVLPLSGPNFFFQFVKLNASGDIVWSQPVYGIYFPANVRQILINEDGDCVFVGQMNNLTIGPESVPPDEVGTSFLSLINSTGHVQSIRIYDFQFIDSIACMETTPRFNNCWIAAIDLDQKPALAKIDSYFDIVDLFVGPSSPMTQSFKIVDKTTGDLAGSFTLGVTTGCWFGAPISVIENGNDPLTQSMFVFQLNLKQQLE